MWSLTFTWRAGPKPGQEDAGGWDEERCACFRLNQRHLLDEWPALSRGKMFFFFSWTRDAFFFFFFTFLEKYSLKTRWCYPVSGSSFKVISSDTDMTSSFFSFVLRIITFTSWIFWKFLMEIVFSPGKKTINYFCFRFFRFRFNVTAYNSFMGRNYTGFLNLGHAQSKIPQKSACSSGLIEKNKRRESVSFLLN